MIKRVIAAISHQLDIINQLITKHSILCACIFSLIVSSLCLLHSAYLDLDNHMIALIANQQFGSENYCIFVNYFFCVLVKFINWLIPTADGYMLICHSLLYVAVAWISYIIISHSKNLHSRIILFMAIVITITGFSTTDISNLNFTIQAAGMFSVGAISIFAGMRSKKTAHYLVFAILFFSFGAMLRIKACLLILPLIALHLFFDFLCSENKQAFMRKALILLIIPTIFVAGIYGSNMIVKKSEKYSTAFSFNAARHKVVDFPQKDWNDVKDQLPDITENDYTSLFWHLYGDTDRINAEYFNNITDVSSNKSKLSLSQIKISFIEALENILQVRKYNIFFIMILALFLLFSNIRFLRKLEIILSAFGVLAISMWLSYNGRILMRLCAPMIIMFVAILALILLSEPIKLNSIIWKRLHLSLVLISVILAGILFGTGILSTNGISSALYAKTGANESKFEQYWKDNNLYVWDTLTMDKMLFGHYAKQGKMATKKCLQHNIAQGEYIYSQAFTDEYFSKLGTKNPVRALVDRENTYYVAHDVTYMQTYLREHVNPSALAFEVGKIDDVTIWKFIVNENAVGYAD